MVISKAYIFSIQKKIAVFSLIVLGIAVLSNINSFVTNVNDILAFIINITSLMIIAGLMILTYINNSKTARLSHIFIYFTIGTLTIIFGSTVSFVGEMLLLFSFILLHIYEVFKIYKLRTTIVFALYILILEAGTQFLSLTTRDYLHSSIMIVMNMALIFFLITVLREEIQVYASILQKYNTYFQLGQNVGALHHSFNLATEISDAKSILEECETGNIEEIKIIATELVELLTMKQERNNNIIQGLKQTQTNEEDVNIIKLLDSVIDLAYINREVVRKINIVKDYEQDQIKIKCVSFELYFLFQNLIFNSIESMLSVNRDEKHILRVSAQVVSNKIVVAFEDTGEDFPDEYLNNKNEIIIDRLLTSKKAKIGFGLLYVLNTIELYNGLLKIEKSANGKIFKLYFKGV